MNTYHSEGIVFQNLSRPGGFFFSLLKEPIFLTSQTLSFFSGVSVSISDIRVVYNYHLALFEKVRSYIDGAFLKVVFFVGICFTEVEMDSYYRETGGHNPAPKVVFARPGGSICGKWHKSASFQQIRSCIAMICKARTIIYTIAILWGFDAIKIHAFKCIPIGLSVSLTNTGTTSGTTSGTNTCNLYTSHALGVFSMETLPRAVFALATQALVYTKRLNPSS